LHLENPCSNFTVFKPDSDMAKKAKKRIHPPKAYTAEQIDDILIESLNSGPATPMTAEDWKRIREAGRRRVLAH
jgi:hypothetical protein